MKSQKPRKKLIGENQMKPDENFHRGGAVTGRFLRDPEPQFLGPECVVSGRMVHEHPNPQYLDRTRREPVASVLVDMDFAEIERRMMADLWKKVAHAAILEVVGKAVRRLREQIDEEGCGPVIAALREPSDD